MPDITMCVGIEHNSMCRICYRRNALPSERQTYFAIPPIDKKGDCRYYWNIGKNYGINK